MRKTTLTAFVLALLTVNTFAGVVPVPSLFYAGSDQTDDKLIYVGQAENGGRLAIDAHAEFMVARDENDLALNWNNCGAFKWSFGFFGFDGPKSEYPHINPNLSGSPALTFDSGDKMRMILEPGYGYTLPDSITDGVLSVEMWVHNPSVEPGEVLIRFEDTTNVDLTAAQFGMTGSSTWQHLAAVSNGSRITFYKNNVPVGTQAEALSFGPDAVINLGARSFSGSFAAVRIHTEPMNTTDISHNYSGGPELGTHLFYPIEDGEFCSKWFGDPTQCAELSWEESEHFRSMWRESENPDPSDDIRARVINQQLPDCEVVYEYLNNYSGKHLPFVSDHQELRGDGRKYKWVAGNGWGGSFMGWSGKMGFGWGISYAGWCNPHEYVHGTDGHQMGNITGNWWETHANFQVSWLGKPQANPVTKCPQHAHVYPSTGGNYYHAYLIWDHLVETPEFGGLYVTRLWNLGPNAGNGGLVFPPQAMQDIDPSPATSFDREWVKMAARNITWDYPSHPEYASVWANQDYKAHKHFTLLASVPYLPAGWYEPPKWRTPQQFGYNLCPLEVNPGTVTCNLTGFVDPAHGSDWSAMFVAVDNGTPRYGSIFTTAEQGSFEVLGGDDELYLVVVATPSNIMEIDMTGDYRGAPKDRFPYQVKLTGTVPDSQRWHPAPGIHGTVDPTASVSPTAYIAPGAKVLGHARVEDYAAVHGTVRDNAIVSGYAVIETSATVQDQARVSDFAIIHNGCTIANEAHVMEHADIDNGVSVSDFAICKGNSYVRGPTYGTGIIDGNYIKNNEVDKGYWFTWSWGGGQNPGELDQEFNQLYLEYRFEQQNAYRVWDTYGATWARLLNGPAYVPANGSTVLELDGSDDFVDLHRSVAVKDTVTFEIDVNWNGGANGQRLLNFSNSQTGDAAWLTPADDQGKLAWTITLDGDTRTIQAETPLPAGTWHTVQLMTYGDTVLLYVDGNEWARGEAVPHDLEDIKADECYIGRGPAGQYFAGRIDDVVVWSKSLVEAEPPTPNPAQFLIPPTRLDGNTVMMQAVRATDTSQPVEYYFEETSGNPGGNDSGWQRDSVYYDGGLAPNTTYTYLVRTRDARGNTGADSVSQTIAAGSTHPDWFLPGPSETVSMEAENYDAKVTGTMYNNSWSVVNNPPSGASGGKTMRVPNRSPKTQINQQYAPDKSPRLDYNVLFEEAGDYYLFVRGNGPNPNDNSCHAGLDTQEIPELQLINILPSDGTYNWVGRVQFNVPHPGVHKLNIWMREDGAHIDKIVISKSSSMPAGDGPVESPRGGGSPISAVPQPNAPTGLSTISGPGYVQLDWADITGPDFLGYNIYRTKTPGGDYKKLNDDLLTASHFKDDDLVGLVPYYYAVTAVHIRANESPYSIPAMGMAAVDTPPAVPTGLTAVTGPGYVDLDWNDNTDADLQGYNLYRAVSSGGPWQKLNDTVLSESVYQDEAATPYVSYYYIVRAVDLGGNESDNSAEVSGAADKKPVVAVLSVTDNTAGGTVMPDSGAISNGEEVSDLTLTWNGVDFGNGKTLELVMKIDAFDVSPYQTNIDIQDVSGDNGLNPRGAVNRPQDDEEFEVAIQLLDGDVDVTADWNMYVADIQTRNQPKTKTLKMEIKNSNTAFLYSHSAGNNTKFKNWASDADNTVVNGPYEMIGQTGGVSFRMGVDTPTDGELLHWSGIKLLFESNLPTVDIVEDGQVNTLDFAALAARWLDAGCQDDNWCGGADLDMNDIVNLADVEILALYWLGIPSIIWR